MEVKKFKHMKFAIMDFLQPKTIQLGLDLIDLGILRWFVDYLATGEMKSMIKDEKVYYWVKYEAVIEQMPALNINNRRSMARRFKKLADANVLLYHYETNSEGNYTFYAMGPEYKNLNYLNPNNTLDVIMGCIDELNEEQRHKLMSHLGVDNLVEKPVDSVDNQGVYSKVQGSKKGGVLKSTGGQKPENAQGGCTQKYIHNISLLTTNESNKHNILNNYVNNNGVKKSNEEKKLEFIYLSGLYLKIKNKDKLGVKETTRLKSLIHNHPLELIEHAIYQSLNYKHLLALVEKLLKEWEEKELYTVKDIIEEDENYFRAIRQQELANARLNEPIVDGYYDWMNE